MSKFCFITGKKTVVGNNRSYSMNATKRKFYPNIHYHRLWLSDKKKFIKIKLSAKALRIIDKCGIKKLLKIKKANKY